MDAQNYQTYGEQSYTPYSYNDYQSVFYNPNYQPSYESNASTVSNYYSTLYYSRENEQMYSPTSYYNYYNNSYNSNDSGYLSTSVQSSPSSVKTKLNYQAEDNLVEQQSGKKRKFGEEFESKVDLESSGHKPSVAKRPKVLKLKNLESKDVEYKCEVCLNVFNSAAKFLMHQFVHHKNGNSKQCPVCFRKFGSYSNAMVHLRGHTQEKLYQCKQCDKSFVDISTLKKHQRIHSGEKPFECHICYKKFSQSGNLTRHLSTHSDDIKSETNIYLNSENESNINNTINYQQMPSVYQEYPTNNLEQNNFHSYNNSIFYNQYQLPQNFEFNYYVNY